MVSADKEDAGQEIVVSTYCLAYNHEKFIRDALEGFVSQKVNFRYEVLVHDDASTDGTARIIREYEEKYPDIIKPIYQKENQYSKGIDIVGTIITPRLKGTYIAICEGDDYWTDPEKLQRQVDILEAMPSCIACVHQTLEIGCRSGRKRLISPYREDGFVDMQTIISGGNKAFQLSSLVFRKKALEEIPQFVSAVKGTGDSALSMFLGLKGDIFFINRTMSVYRMLSSESSWTSRMAADEKAWLKHCRETIDMLRSVDCYTEGKFHEMFDRELAKFEYELERAACSSSVFLLPRYAEYWKREPLVKKLRYFIKLMLPPPIRNRWKK